MVFRLRAFGAPFKMTSVVKLSSFAARTFPST